MRDRLNETRLVGASVPLRCSTGSYTFDAQTIGAVNRALDEGRPLVVYEQPGAAKRPIGQAIAQELERPFVRGVVDARTELADLLTTRVDEDERPGPLWWALNWADAARRVEPQEEPSDGSFDTAPVLVLDEMEKAGANLCEALFESLASDQFLAPGAHAPVPRTSRRPLVVFKSTEDCVLPDIFSDCVTLHLSASEPASEQNDADSEGVGSDEAALASHTAGQVQGGASLPKIKGAPIVGVLPQILRKHLEALDDWFERGDDIFDISLMGLTLKIVARGELAAEGVINNRTCYARSPVFSEGLSLVTGESLLTLDGPKWRERRQALQPKFHARVIESMVDRIHGAFDSVLDQVEPGRIELASLCDRLTMSVGLTVMFGFGITKDTFEELQVLSPIVISRVAVGWLTSKLPKWLRLPGEARFRAALARLDEIIYEMIAKRRASAEFGDDFLATLLHMAEDGELDDVCVRNEAVTMLLAGYETTSNTLSWTIHTMAEYPEVQAKIRAEVEAVGIRGDEQGLKYCRNAFKEGLRLNPAALWFPRVAVKDTSIGGHAISAGQTIVCSTYLIHRNPKDWPEPRKFDPDRFARDTPRYAFMPFGIGQQMCIGKHLAVLEGQLALAKIFSRWQVIPVTDHKAEKRISTTLSNKDGIYVEFRALTAD